MRKEIKKVKNKRTKISVFHILIAVLSIYVIVTFVKQEFVIRELTKKDEITDKNLKELKKDISNLESKIDKSDTVKYVEKIAREELDMIKPNEIIYKDKNKESRSSISD